MNLDRRTLEPAENSLFGFGGKKRDALGKKAILVSFTEGEKVRRAQTCSKLVQEKCVHIGSDLTKEKKDSLLVFLHENQDVFA